MHITAVAIPAPVTAGDFHSRQLAGLVEQSSFPLGGGTRNRP